MKSLLNVTTRVTFEKYATRFLDAVVDGIDAKSVLAPVHIVKPLIFIYCPWLGAKCIVWCVLVKQYLMPIYQHY